MPLRRGTPLTFTPRGCSDAVDGTPVPAGAMAQLSNLVPDPSTDGVFSCRPASIELTAFPGFTTPGFVSGRVVIGNLEYGMIASGLNPGFDQPYVYNLATNAFLTVNGITAANVPVSPPATGDWVPPILAQVASRIIVCHPGFPGGAGFGQVKFGWFDISGFSETAKADTISADTTLFGNYPILGVQPGMTVTGAGIPANTTVIGTNHQITVEAAGLTTSNATVTLVSTNGIFVGMEVAGSGIPAGASVVSIVTNTSATLDQEATVTSTETLTFTGTQIAMSNAATATADAVNVTIAGGTTTAPLWGAGDVDGQTLLGTAEFFLPSVPVAVAQFYGRAYYALGTDGIVFSDSGFPCRVSNLTAVQALTTDDGLAVTMVAPLLLSSPITGGIVQAIVAFEGTAKIQQITGDQSLGNLLMNAMPVATGTLANLSVVPCEIGLAFVCPQGLRVIEFSGAVSPIIGERGRGKAVPFIYALHPSRICAAANVDVLRLSVQRGDLTDNPTQEWWYDLRRSIWTGPHTFPASLIQPWQSTFVITPVGMLAQLWRTDAYADLNSTFEENGTQLTWNYQPSPLPDTGMLAENALVDMTVAISQPAIEATTTGDTIAGHDVSMVADATGIAVGQLVKGTGIPGGATVISFGIPTIWGGFNWGGANWGASPGTEIVLSDPATLTQRNRIFQFGQFVLVTAGDISGRFLGTTVCGTGQPTVWGEFVWGQALWGGDSTYQQVSVEWYSPLTFKQLNLTFAGTSNFDTKIGNIYMRYDILGYRLQAAS